MTTYAEKLRDPRWQKRRLEVLERAGWKCENCGCSDRQLHVHHNVYFRGKSPWEYDDVDLQALCDLCHDTQGQTDEVLKGYLSLADECLQVIGYLKGIALSKKKIAGVHLDGHCECVGFSHHFGMPVGAVVNLARSSEDHFVTLDMVEDKAGET